MGAGGSQRSTLGTIPQMWSWIWIAVLYVAGIGFFRWLGGIGAAADAIKRWGSATAERERRRTSPSA